MLVYVSEERLAEMAEKTNKMMVFSLEKGNKYKTISEALEIEVPYIELLPDAAALQEIGNGNIGRKSVIKKALKMLKEPEKTKNTDFPPSIYVLLSIIIRNTKNGIITAIIEPEFGDNSRLEKFARSYIQAIFSLFGYKVICPDANKKDKKFLKDLFKGKKKALKGKIKGAVRDSAMDSDGVKRYNAIHKAYELEIMSNSLDQRLRDGSLKLNKKQKQNLKKSLVKAITKKSKISKKLNKYYAELKDLEAFDLPKTKKLDKIKSSLVPVVVRHVASRRLGLEFGSKEYFREMSPILKAVGADEKAFKELVAAAIK